MVKCDVRTTVLMKIQVFCDMTLYWIIVYDASVDLAASIFGLQISLPSFKMEATNSSKTSVFIYQVALSYPTRLEYSPTWQMCEIGYIDTFSFCFHRYF